MRVRLCVSRCVCGCPCMCVLCSTAGACLTPTPSPADLGRCFFQMRMPGHEIPLLLYHISLHRSGHHHITFYNLGLCYLEAEDYERAVSMFEKCLAMDGAWAVLARVAGCQSSLGHHNGVWLRGGVLRPDTYEPATISMAKAKKHMGLPPSTSKT